MGSCAAPSAKGDDKFITTDYLQQCLPDFPPCPFGQSFSILGFDTAEQEYVWLVTSIIRDPRLIRVPYQGEDVISDE